MSALRIVVAIHAEQERCLRLFSQAQRAGNRNAIRFFFFSLQRLFIAKTEKGSSAAARTLMEAKCAAKLGINAMEEKKEKAC